MDWPLYSAHLKIIEAVGHHLDREYNNVCKQ